MKAIIKNALLNNLTLKVISLILGYSFWQSCSNTQTIHTTFTIPVCFYNTADTHKLEAPDKIEVTLQATRAQLQNLNVADLAVHIDSQTLHTGPNTLNVCNDTLLLPSSVKLVHYTPTNVIVTVNESQINNTIIS